jgi:hypothetical protein
LSRAEFALALKIVDIRLKMLIDIRTTSVPE